MILPKDLIEMMSEEKWFGEIKPSQLFQIEQFISLAYRRGAEDMGKQAMEILVSEKEELLLYYHPDANGTRIEKSFNEALRLIQERKDNFLKEP